MLESYSWEWVEARAAETAAQWERSAGRAAPAGEEYNDAEHARRERAYDAALVEVEREIKRAPRSRAARLKVQQRTMAAFARFAAAALDLGDDAIELLTHDFLPVGTGLAQWARRFDAGLSMADIIQACRNAWTACGLQPLLGERIRLTPSILGYSLLYPYSDNFLDNAETTREAKLRFSVRFRERLGGGLLEAADERERRLWALVALVESEYARGRFPQVFEGMLAIHRAQEGSLAQVVRGGAHAGSNGHEGGKGGGKDGGKHESKDDAALLALSCAKGGSSVLADACMGRGWLDAAESRFAFAWGVLLQLGDDLQDVREDMRRGSVTLFSRTALAGETLDALTRQLLNFAVSVGEQMEALPEGSPMLKELLRTSWRSLIVGAVADSHMYFSPEFVVEAERWSPFRFAFLRERRELLASREGLYARLFEAFLEGPEMGAAPPLPEAEAVGR